MGTHQSKSVHS